MILFFNWRKKRKGFTTPKIISVLINAHQMKFINYIFIFIILSVFSCKKDTPVKSTPKINSDQLVWKIYSNDIYGFCNSTYIPVQYFSTFTLDKNNVAWLPITSG